jgi:DNA-directed RNA polymerase specialized sigma24 family protein
VSILDYQTASVRAVGDEAHAKVLRRAAYLRPADRALLEMTLRGKLSRREIGALMGIPSGTVTRRVWRLGNRLHDPLVVALIERPGKLRAEYRQVGLEHFVQGLTARDIADLHRMGVKEVRRILDFLRVWAKAMI